MESLPEALPRALPESLPQAFPQGYSMIGKTPEFRTGDGKQLWTKGGQVTQSENIKMYDEVADTYDDVLEREGWVMPETMSKRVALLLEDCAQKDPQQCFQLLDFGAGTGSLGAKLKQKLPAMSLCLVATDVSNCMLDKARENSAYNSVICGDLADATVAAEVAAAAPGGYHVAVANGVLAGGAPVLVEAVTNVLSLLCSGGIFLFNVRPESEGGPNLSLLYTQAVESNLDVTVKREQIQAWREDVGKDQHTLWVVTRNTKNM